MKKTLTLRGARQYFKWLRDISAELEEVEKMVDEKKSEIEILERMQKMKGIVFEHTEFETIDAECCDD